MYEVYTDMLRRNEEIGMSDLDLQGPTSFHTRMDTIRPKVSQHSIMVQTYGCAKVYVYICTYMFKYMRACMYILVLQYFLKWDWEKHFVRAFGIFCLPTWFETYS